MRFSILTAALLAGAATAHNQVTHFHVNGAAETKCVRMAVNTNPVADLTSEAMACNVVSETTAEKCEVTAGDEVAFEYRAEPDKAPEEVALKEGSIKVGVTDDSHKGPCAVYAKKVDDAATAEGAGEGWFKLEHDGVKDGEFCTTRLNNADAPLKATIPKSLAPGDYLLRAEILTLNNAAPDGEREPQFYPGCVQVTISGGDGTAKPETVAIPGYLNTDSPGLLYNIWTKTDYSDYEIPGPPCLAPPGDNAPEPSGDPSPSATAAPEPEMPIASPPIPTSFPITQSIIAPINSISTYASVSVVLPTTYTNPADPIFTESPIYESGPVSVPTPAPALPAESQPAVSSAAPSAPSSPAASPAPSSFETVTTSAVPVVSTSTCVETLDKPSGGKPKPTGNPRPHRNWRYKWRNGKKVKVEYKYKYVYAN